jgi:hypothetical protein
VYEQSLKVFEVFVQAIKNDSSTQGEGNRDLQAIFDFILSQKFKINGDENEKTVKVTIDILTIVSLHIVVVEDRKVGASGSGAERQGQMTSMPRGSFLLDPAPQNRLLMQLLKLDFFKIIMSLIQINNLQICEHTVKILQMLISISEVIKKDFQDKQGFQIIAHILSRKSSSFSLCQTVLNAILGSYDNPNDLRQLNNTLVQQVMNKSLIAREIVNQTNVALNKPKKTKLVYFELFDIFFQCVGQLGSDDSRCHIFKVL